jgi:hypothetical protein
MGKAAAVRPKVAAERALHDNGHERGDSINVTDRPFLTAVDTMTLSQARTVSGRRGARLVLLMGEAGTGKTALIATLWQRFLEADGLADHRLAGSRTPLGLERRAHWLRLDSEQPFERFPSTRFEDGAVLHVRVRRPDGELVELLLADLAGEQFERVREGRPLLEEIPWGPRVDRFVVLMDAQALSVTGESEIAVTRAQRLILSLRSPGVVRETARVALAYTKVDTLARSGENALRRHEEVLLAAAQAVDPEATSFLTAALAREHGDPPGFGDWLAWLCIDDRPKLHAPVPEVAPERAIAAFNG